MYREVIRFWFEEAKPAEWFSANPSFDQKIREKFETTYWYVVRGESKPWQVVPQGRLAEVIVLDQFSRNIFRGTPQAFAEDARALQLAREAVALGVDKKLPAKMRHFLYMPYMHSEDRAVHKEAVWLFASLLPWQWSGLYYELKHKKIIDRFGRYPHRNQVLGRPSTPEEEEFLKTDKGF